MHPSRRQAISRLITGIAVAPLAPRALAQTGPVARPPIIFAHGNGDHAALWLTTLWRFESNGWPRDRLFAFNFTDPLAAPDVTVATPGRSRPNDQLRELTAVVAAARAQTGAERVALIGSSRGGYAIRNFVVEAGGSNQVSHAVLCGTPNRGVHDWEANPNGEFNGRGPFLRALNRHERDTTPGTAFLTIRSDNYDKFAQPDGRLQGKPGVPTGVDADGPSLRGAKNVVIPQLDHREVAFHAFAFREQFQFIADAAPGALEIAPEPQITLDGLVTGAPNGEQTNRPVAGAIVEIYKTAPDNGERIGEALLKKTTGADGRWGPVVVASIDRLEFVLAAPGHPTTHIYRSPFPRSSNIVHLRPGRPLNDADRAAGAVVLMTRPRGYFGIPRDVILLGGKEAADVTKGVPTDATTTLRLPGGEASRPIKAQFNEEQITARAWPAAENRLSIAELTW